MKHFQYCYVMLLTAVILVFTGFEAKAQWWNGAPGSNLVWTLNQVSVGTNTPPALTSVYVTSPDASVVFNGLPTSTTPSPNPNLGAGDRFMWIPGSNALRAGGVSSLQWNDPSVGDYSVALGWNCEAPGIASVAMGWESIAEDEYCIALGEDVQANVNSGSGHAAVAIGGHIEATNGYAVGIGAFSLASGQESMALGYELDVNGLRSIAIGSGFSGIALQNPIANSIMLGSNSDFPTVFIESASGLSTFGRVGIGTISPVQVLDVNGAIRLNNTNTASPGTIRYNINNVMEAYMWDSNVGGMNWVPWCDNCGGSTPDNDWTVSGNDMWSIPTGNTGIGTNTPQNKLDVAGAQVIGSGYAGTNTAPANSLLVEGEVGIGYTTNPGTHKLYVNGSVYAIGGYFPSDARWKENIVQIQGALDKVLNLRGVSFDYKHTEFPEINFEKSKQIGFIAQELEKVVPEVVITNTDGTKGVSYQNLTAVLAEAIKEQQSTIEELRGGLAAQTAVNREMREVLNDALRQIAELKTEVHNAGNLKQGSIDTQTEAQVFLNDPNPFSEHSIVNFYVPNSVVRAEFLVTEAASGREALRIPVAERGSGALQVHARDLGSSGSYFYTLVLDGRALESRTMIVLK